MPQESIKFLSALPYPRRKELCSNLDMDAKWGELAGELGYTPKDIYQFGMAVQRMSGFNSPSEDLIRSYCHRNPTIEELYFKLMKLQLISAANTLKDFVSEQALSSSEPRNIRNAGEGSDSETTRRDLPRPSQQPVQLQVYANVPGDMTYGYPGNPYSDSNNSSGNYGHGGQNAYRVHSPYPAARQNGYPSGHGGRPAGPVGYLAAPGGYPAGSGGYPAAPGGYSAGHGGYSSPQNGFNDPNNRPCLRPANPSCTASQRDQFTREYGMQHQEQPSAPVPNKHAHAIGCNYNPFGKQPTNMHYASPSNAEQRLEINFSNIKRATYGFHTRKIEGQDRFGVLYKGKLGDQYLTVKQMKKIRDDKTGFDITDHLSKEVDILKRCFHPNIIPLLKYIDEMDGEGGVYLVYPYMENGSLRENLEKKENKESLKWECKVKILKEAASGLVYLHDKMGQKPYVHGDISSENILLDDRLTAKLTGFGLAQAATGGSTFEQHTHVSQSFLKNTLFGAQEYMPPEFKELPQLSTKGDVFAFGVVILETCTGLQAFDDRREGGKLLWEYVSQLGDNSEEFAASLNDRRQPMPYKTWEKLFNLGKKCISRKKKHRPTAREVLTVLDNLYEKEVCEKNDQNTMQFTNGGGTAGNSWRMDFNSLKKEFDTEAVNPHLRRADTEDSSAAKLPLYGAFPLPTTGLPNDSQSNVGQQAAYLQATPAYDDTCRQPTENASRSDSSGVGTMEAIESLNFERPGNTCEIPRFVTYEQATDTNVLQLKLLDACEEQSESCHNRSNSSKQASSEYSFAKSDLNIITGSAGSSFSDKNHDYQKNDMAVLSCGSSAQEGQNTSEAPIPSGGIVESNERNGGIVIQSSDVSDFAGHDYRQSDLDILTAPSSVCSQRSNIPALSENSASETCVKQADLSSGLHGLNDVRLDPQSSTPCVQTGRQSDLEALNREFHKLSATSALPSDADTGFMFGNTPVNLDQQNYDPMSFSSESLKIHFPGDFKQEQFPESQQDVFATDLDFTSPDPSGFFEDSNVQVNDSVTIFVDNSNYNSTASSHQSSTARAEPEFLFNYDKEDSTSISAYPQNIACLEKKADDLFD